MTPDTQAVMAALSTYHSLKPALMAQCTATQEALDTASDAYTNSLIKHLAVGSKLLHPDTVTLLHQYQAARDADEAAEHALQSALLALHDVLTANQYVLIGEHAVHTQYLHLYLDGMYDGTTNTWQQDRVPHWAVLPMEL